MYIYIHIYIYIYIYMYIHIDVYIYMYEFVRICLSCVGEGVYIYIHIYIHIHIHVYTYWCIYICVWVRADLLVVRRWGGKGGQLHIWSYMHNIYMYTYVWVRADLPVVSRMRNLCDMIWFAWDTTRVREWSWGIYIQGHDSYVLVVMSQMRNLRWGGEGGWEVGGWGRDPFSRNFMKPTPRCKWHLTTGRRFH